ncbi:MAG: hypothetical protein LBT30_06575 [Clostridiales bacterium]|nr:hypothetical protein [Clostridiales bacterium]
MPNDFFDTSTVGELEFRFVKYTEGAFAEIGFFVYYTGFDETSILVEDFTCENYTVKNYDKNYNKTFDTTPRNFDVIGLAEGLYFDNRQFFNTIVFNGYSDNKIIDVRVELEDFHYLGIGVVCIYYKNVLIYCGIPLNF